jgi:hypothetical protein
MDAYLSFTLFYMKSTHYIGFKIDLYDLNVWIGPIYDQGIGYF